MLALKSPTGGKAHEDIYLCNNYNLHIVKTLITTYEKLSIL